MSDWLVRLSWDQKRAAILSVRTRRKISGGCVCLLSRLKLTRSDHVTSPMAHARPSSSGPDSSAGSSAGLPPLSGLNKMGVLPEEWTLPHEWKIEKREPFDNWKMDVQSQISNLSTSLNKSLGSYPHPEVGDRLRSVGDATLLEWEAARRDTQRRRENSAGIRLGVTSY